MKQDRFTALKERTRRYMQQYDPAFVTEYMRRQCPLEAGQVIAQADRLMGQTFTDVYKRQEEELEAFLATGTKMMNNLK